MGPRMDYHPAMRSIGWLVDGSGARLRLTPGGVLLGRGADCDVVLDSQRASRRHALVRMGSAGPEVVPLGRNPTTVNGEPLQAVQAARDGDRVGLPGAAYRVVVEHGPTGTDAAWALEHVGGGVFGITGSPFVLGDDGDDLVLGGWPRGALTVSVTTAGLVAEAGCGVVHNGYPFEAGSLLTLAPGDTVTVADQSVRVLVTGGGQGTTVTAGSTAPVAVRLAFLPRGGRLHLDYRDGTTQTTWLADRRCDLVACLLRPPAPHKPGDLVDDPVLFGRIWPREPYLRTKLNTLIYQTRKGLVRAGMNGVALIERAPGGGATRFVLGDRARVAVE